MGFWIVLITSYLTKYFANEENNSNDGLQGSPAGFADYEEFEGGFWVFLGMKSQPCSIFGEAKEKKK